MSQEVFDSLSQSLKEAGAILRGETDDYREFKKESEPQKRESNALAVCVETDDADLLIVGKIYVIKILNDKRIAVTDESGETVICPKDDFLIVEFQPKIEKKLRELVTV